MRFEFLNLQPLGLRLEDCVCRAISLALNENYYKIERKLELIAELFECEKLCVCCYKHLLDSVYNLKRIESFEGLSIEDFAELNPFGTFIVRVEGHLTTVIDAVNYDTFDTSERIVDIVWQVE